MRKINKNPEPTILKRWKSKNKGANYNSLFESQRWDILNEISQSCAAEQLYLCAYCCARISGDISDTRNEHVEARMTAPHRSLDFSNIVASCKTKGQCDNSHRAQNLPLTPLMNECETELRFKISGRVEGLSQRAKDSIQVLNLGDNEKNNKALIERRKQLSQGLLWRNGVNPDEGLEDEDLIKLVIDDLERPIEGRLEAYAPVVVNILRSWTSE